MVWLRTHATQVTPDLADALRRLEVARVCVDLFGANAPTHDAGTGRPGSFEDTCRGIATLQGAGLSVLPLMILSRRTAPELQRFLELARHLECKEASILRLYPIGRARDRWAELACSLPEMTEALAALRPPAGLSVMQSWHPRNGNCCWESAAVTAEGHSIGCPYLRSFVDHGDVLTEGFIATWQKPLYRRLRAGPEGGSYCGGCATHEDTVGGCRSTAFAFTGDWDAADPFCPDSNRGTDLTALPSH